MVGIRPPRPKAMRGDLLTISLLHGRTTSVPSTQHPSWGTILSLRVIKPVSITIHARCEVLDPSRRGPTTFPTSRPLTSTAKPERSYGHGDFPLADSVKETAVTVSVTTTMTIPSPMPKEARRLLRRDLPHIPQVETVQDIQSLRSVNSVFLISYPGKTQQTGRCRKGWFIHVRRTGYSRSHPCGLRDHLSSPSGLTKLEARLRAISERR